MSMLPMVCFLVFTIAALLCLGFSIYKSRLLVTQPTEKLNFGGYFKQEILLITGFAVAFVAMIITIYPWAKITAKPIEILQAIIGALFFSASLGIAINSFIVHYYGNSFERKRIPEEIDKVLFACIIAGFASAIIALFILSNGFADYLKYPLANAFCFTKGFVNPGQASEGLTITFYALFILTGALIVYFLCDHKMYQEYGEHGMLESTFLVAFPAGIIGARIFYVIGNFNVPVGAGGFGGEFTWRVFAIWEGGLTILGGAIMGIAAGMLWFIWRHRKINVLLVADMVVPCILIAQAVGRWGNFFNCEVHGMPISEDYFWWLPRIIVNNAHYSSANISSALPAGNIYLPLFFIEGVVNLFGFGLLAHLFGKRLRKYCEFGDIIFGYVIWYGLTRVLMEPLRDPSFNMGNDGYWSWIWSMIFVAVGAFAILGNHVIRYFIRKKQNQVSYYRGEDKKAFITALCVAIPGLILIIAGIVMLVSGTYNASIAYSVFNGGLILLVLGIAAIFIAGAALLNFIVAKKINNKDLINE
ncbi:MAG: prolipoprotein diacylglyceryl transferase [Bacilli bacterium]|nr:prolipoprotein diacylglyceryl transferase [Bacilli bacterium]